jgi:hypothetical protein
MMLRPGERELAEHGAYLEDGKRLYRVLDAAEGMVKLENCKRPGERPAWVPVRRVVSTMRRVRVSS